MIGSTREFRRWLSRRRVAVLLGGDSAERPISLKTGHAILSALRRQGIAARAIDPKTHVAEQLRRHRINFAYLALHGPGGEDGVIQGLLEWMKIPYTGSGVLASAVCMDKAVCKAVLAQAGLPVAGGAVLTDKTVWTRQFRLPLVVKPATQGSAVGVSIVRSRRQWAPALKAAFRYDSRVLVESFLDGPEITVGVLGDLALPVIEIVPNDRPFYDFKAKYAPGGSRHILPARLPPDTTRRVQQLSVAACRAVGVRAVARVDLIVDRRRGPVILEINTIPGMTQTSLLPEAARAAGLDFDALVLRIADLSVVR